MNLNFYDNYKNITEIIKLKFNIFTHEKFYIY